MMNDKIKQTATIVYLALLVAMIFWGFSFIWSKMVFTVYKPITTVFLRLVLSSSFLWIVGLLTGKLQKIKKYHIKGLILVAFFEPFLYFIGENYGLMEISSTVAAVLISTIPLFSPIAAYFFLKEKISLMNIFGIFISILGVLMVIMKDDLTLAASTFGILAMLFAVVAAVGYSIVVSKMAKEYNVFSLITYQNTIGIVMFLPFFLIFDLKSFLSAEVTNNVILALIGLAIFASSLAFMLFTYGIQHIGVTKANTFGNIIPVFTAIFAWILLNERLNFLNILGIIVVVGGLFLSQLKFNFSTLSGVKN